MEGTFEYIEIKNFRCFEHTKISGFEAVNLIGGKNNSGKTALLEALWLNAMPFASSIMLMQALRKEDENLAKQFPEKAWENLFFNQQQDKKILIKSNAHGINLEVRIEYENLEKEQKFYVLDNYFNNNPTQKRAKKTTLTIDYTDGIKKKSPFSGIQDILINHNGEIKIDMFEKDSFDSSDKYKAMFIYSKKDVLPKELAQSFDNNLNFYDDVLKGFQIIDSSIIDARTIRNNIMLRRKGENYMPLALFGDAIYKMATIILSLLNGKKGNILLIDEIENGIHYTHHQKFWEFLFELSNKFGIQIFATSHSLEMITAFNEVARKRNTETKGKYFEMSRHAKTNKILANAMNMDTLHYEIQKKHAFRGE